MLLRSLGWEDSPGGGHGNPLQCSCLENSLNRGAWRATVPWGHKESENSSDLTHMHACTCMYRCIWEELWVYIVFMWSMYQSNTCTPSIAFPFLKFFWKNWAFRLEFVTCKFLFQQKWQWSNYTFSANRSLYLISPSLYIAIFLCFLLFCFPLCVCVCVCVCVWLDLFLKVASNLAFMWKACFITVWPKITCIFLKQIEIHTYSCKRK